MEKPTSSFKGNTFFDLEVKANLVYRNETLEMCIDAGTGHVTSSMSCVEILTALYDIVMKHDPKNPEWDERDRFVLSKGQASPILYVVLTNQGYFSKEHLKKFAVGEDGKGAGAPFGVHLQCDVPGVEFTTGSLGHGLGYAVGVAKVAKMNKKDYFTYVLLGDGELYEGSNWESALFASHHKLNNLIAIIDRNLQCTNGYTERDIVKLDSIESKFESFGWNVKGINGHSIKEIVETINYQRIDSSKEKPLAIIANTVKGKGIESLEGRMYFHGLAPKGEDILISKRDLKKFTEEHIKNGGYHEL